jgi:hypothetical protein
MFPTTNSVSLPAHPLPTDLSNDDELYIVFCLILAIRNLRLKLSNNEIFRKMSNSVSARSDQKIINVKILTSRRPVFHPRTLHVKFAENNVFYLSVLI